jgi:hypothetical protein
MTQRFSTRRLRWLRFPSAVDRHYNRFCRLFYSADDALEERDRNWKSCGWQDCQNEYRGLTGTMLMQFLFESNLLSSYDESPRGQGQSNSAQLPGTMNRQGLAVL